MFDPELVVYNAGTDILDGDPLGRLKVILSLDMYKQLGSLFFPYFIYLDKLFPSPLFIILMSKLGCDDCIPSCFLSIFVPHIFPKTFWEQM